MSLKPCHLTATANSKESPTPNQISTKLHPKDLSPHFPLSSKACSDFVKKLQGTSKSKKKTIWRNNMGVRPDPDMTTGIGILKQGI